MIGLDDAKALCGDRVMEGQPVLISYRLPQEDPDGSTRQVTCVVGRIPEAADANLIFREHPGLGLPDFRSASPLGGPRSRKSSLGGAEFDQDEFQERRAKIAAQMASEMARGDMRNRKRPPEDDDGRQHPARRPRRGEY